MNFCINLIYRNKQVEKLIVDDYNRVYVRILYSNTFFSYRDVLYIKAFECDLSPYADVNACWQYFNDHNILPAEDIVISTVSMQGFETFNLLDADFPQNKMYNFYKCLNRDWTQWLLFNPEFNNNLKNLTLDPFYTRE